MEEEDEGDPCFTLDLSSLISLADWQSLSTAECQAKLVELLVTDTAVEAICVCCRPILPDLCGRLLSYCKSRTHISPQQHLGICCALSKVLVASPNLLGFVLRYFEDAPAPFNCLENVNLQSVLVTCLRFLRCAESTFARKWNWHKLLPSMTHHDPMISWYTLSVCSIVFGLSDARVDVMRSKFLPNEHAKFRVQALFEQEREERELRKQACVKPRSSGPAPCIVQVSRTDLHPLTVCVGDVLLCRRSSSLDMLHSHHLVQVASTSNALSEIARAVNKSEPVLLEGAVGVGKTSLVDYLAAVTGNGKALVSVQLSDQTDSKMLIGSYCCTDMPGQFVWRPGVLTQAVKEGTWIILEDIDTAPMSVISLLLPLLESRTLTLPGHSQSLTCATGFQMFITRRCRGISSGTTVGTGLIEKLCTLVKVAALSAEELKTVVDASFEALQVISSRLVEVFHSLLEMNTTSSLSALVTSGGALANRRQFSLRDFMKWCSRLNVLADQVPSIATAGKEVFQEALDCFCASVSSPEVYPEVAGRIATLLGITKPEVQYYCKTHTPAVQAAATCVHVGRSTMIVNEIQKPVTLTSGIVRYHAYTRPTVVLLEQLAGCVTHNEPVLLVGETGTGKTSTVQHLAELSGHELVVINLSQQTDSSDLLGGFKPVSLQHLIRPFKQDFEQLFRLSFSVKKNAKFLRHVQESFSKENWEILFQLMGHTIKATLAKQNAEGLHDQWQDLSRRLGRLQEQLKRGAGAFVFAFVEGKLVDAVRKGHWLLLDEINLASPDTLECLISLMEPNGSILLMEKGDLQPVHRHPDFRLFACMNPATDIGKRNLPVGVRNRFTELFVAELEKAADLEHLVHEYLRRVTVGHTRAYVGGVVRFYLAAKKAAEEKYTDGTGHRPHYSLRTLCRGLRLASCNLYGSMERSLFEGLLFSFLTQLDRQWHPALSKLIHHHVLPDTKIDTLIKHSLPMPTTALPTDKFVKVEGYWIQCGPQEPVTIENYVLTPAVKANLRDISRAVAAGRPPVLLQGPTSVGKTSLIRYLSSLTGHVCMRINNHEHTDLQEYLGSYVTGSNGQLVFQEGVLVTAMRHGHWVILDELNLAPTDVLEALNRVLDDNRELVIPETGQVVKAHPKFMLFATQNPAGLYGGRKMLSRALRNRFIELHFTEMPSAELKTILEKLCSIPGSYAARMVAVMQDLQTMRKGSSVFEGKHGFITLRDLFRWAERYRRSPKYAQLYDWDQHLAEDGFLLLAGRVRRPDEEVIIRSVLEKRFKCSIDTDRLFGNWSAKSSPVFESMSPATRPVLEAAVGHAQQSESFKHLVWTRPLRRLVVLAGRAMEFDEPLLLVGETGCGKTTVCQLLSELRKQKLYCVNCHMHSEAGDFLGGLRPVRATQPDEEPSKLFEWQDGPLVCALLDGGAFLVDEISLADDSVLERLNSVLEPERSLLLAEKSMDESDVDGSACEVRAKEGFCFLATMNPGGDFGKKELSPALRNRFTEIWCPEADDSADICAIVDLNIRDIIIKDLGRMQKSIGQMVVDFLQWLTTHHAKQLTVSIRDLLSWITFINEFAQPHLYVLVEDNYRQPLQAYVHGACLVLLDSLGSSELRQSCLDFLMEQVGDLGVDEDCIPTNIGKDTHGRLSCGSFHIEKGPNTVVSPPFALKAPTTSENALRVLRAFKLERPILLEGSPGVGKTSLISAIAKQTGYKMTRINLSEQTDVTDLFGADLPVENGKGGQFAWRDGPFLSALKEGHWIMLDELNLASQSVLEGLNACLDHRGEVYIPELGKSFKVQHGSTRIFACQNPLQQGGGRKGLPKSFLNRFTQVYVEPLTADDLLFIGKAIYPSIPQEMLKNMISFNAKVHKAINVERSISLSAGLWEFNLRDVFRWCDLMMTYQNGGPLSPGQFVDLLYAQRMRHPTDRMQVLKLYVETFNYAKETSLFHLGGCILMSPSRIQLGQVILPRSEERPPPCSYTFNHEDNSALEALATSLQMGWMTILVGPSSSRRSAVIRTLAYCCGLKLVEMPVNSAMDTTELLGGFEQVDNVKKWLELITDVEHFAQECIREALSYSAFLNTAREVWANLSPTCTEIDKLYTELTCLKAMNHQELTPEHFQQCHFVLYCISSMLKAAGMGGVHAAITVLKEKLDSLASVLSSTTTMDAGCFKWVDSLLVTAARQGHWILLDNANFCSPSVLDRLNAMLEPDGVLTIDERGLEDGEIVTVKPQPNFRLILSMDPKHGELSRAMRNRGIEVCLLDSSAAEEDEDDDQKNDTDQENDADVDSMDVEEDSCMPVAEHVAAMDDEEEEEDEEDTEDHEDDRPAWDLPLSTHCSDSQLARAVHESNVLSMFDIEREDIKSNDLFNMALDLYILQSTDEDIALRREIINTWFAEMKLPIEEFGWVSARFKKPYGIEHNLARLKLNDGLDPNLGQFYLPADIFEHTQTVHYIDQALEDHDDMAPVISTSKAAVMHVELHSQEHDEEIPPFSLHALSKQPEDVPTVAGVKHRAIISKIAPLVESSFDLLRGYIRDEAASLTEAALDAAMRGLFWRRQFVAFVRQPVGWTTLAEMLLMWSWFDKHVVSLVNRVCPHVPEEFNATVRQMRTLLPQYERWAVSGEEWPLLIGHPPPLSSKKASDCWISLYRSADQLVSALTGRTLSVAASTGKLPELKQLWFTCVELLRNLWLSLLVNNPVPEAMVEKCHSCSDQINKALMACHAANEDAAMLDALSAGQHMATSGLEVDLTSFALMSPFLMQALRAIVTRVTSLATVRHCLQDTIDEGLGQDEVEALTAYIAPVIGYTRQYSVLVPVVIVALLESLRSLLQSSQDMNTLSSRCGHILPALTSAVLSWSQQYKQSDLSNVSLSSVLFNLFSTSEAAMKSSITGLRNDVSGSASGSAISLNAFSLAAQSNSERFLNDFQWHLWINAVQERQRRWTQIKANLLTQFMHIVAFITEVPSQELHDTLQDSFDQYLNSIANAANEPFLFDNIDTDAFHGDELSGATVDDLEAYVGDILQGFNNFMTLDSWNVDLGASARAAQISIKMSLFKMRLVTPCDQVDPAVRRTLCIDHCQQMSATLRCQRELQRAFDMLRFGRNSSLYALVCEQLYQDQHGCVALSPFAMNPFKEKRLHQRMLAVAELVQENKQSAIYRPEADGYSSLVQTMTSFKELLADSQKIDLLLNPLCTALSEGVVADDVEHVQNALQAAQTWQQSVQQFCSTMQHSYAQYADVAEPCVAAANEISDAVQWVMDECKEKYGTWNLGKGYVVLEKALCTFPLPPNSFFHRNTIHAEKLLADGLLNLRLPSSARTSCLVSAFSHIHLGVVLNGSLTKYQSLLRKVQRAVADLWWQVKAEEIKKAEEEAEMYKRKGQSHGDSLAEVEEAVEENLRSMFPTFDGDFEDLNQPSSFENSAPKQQPPSSADSSADVGGAKPLLFQTSDMHHMCVMHEKIVLERATTVDTAVVSNSTVELVRDGFNAACRLNEARLRTYAETSADGSLTCDVDDALRLPALLVCHNTRKTLSKPAPIAQSKPSQVAIPCAQDTKTSYDIYHDPNPAEVQLAQPVLTQFLDAVNKFLEQWPEHPALLQLTVVIRRVLSFPLQSSLMKVLQGLELLLQKSQDWESYAARAVSLQTHIEAVTDLILRWRRLELKFWPSILETCAHRVAAEASRWWMHLNQLLFSDDEDKDLDATMEAVQTFIEASPVGEFPSRLRMLKTFYTQIVADKRRHYESLCPILWNAYHYYSQFTPEVCQWVQHKKTPLEKELKGFVRIARWNDANYWAIKQATEKTHRKLHSYVVKFRNILAEPVSTVLRTSSVLAISSDHADVKQEPGTSAQRPIGKFTATPSTSIDAATLEDPSMSELVKRLPSLSARTVKLQERLWKKCPHHQLTESVDEFAGEIASTIQHLQDLPVEGSTPEERTKSFKRILVQKRNALTSLFKASKTIGLSFRKGVRLAATILDEHTLRLPCLLEPSNALLLGAGPYPDDLQSCIGYADSVWTGCHKYFMRCATRSPALEIALSSPSKELTRVELERCRGLAAHLYSLLHEQRELASGFVKQLKITSIWSLILSELKDYSPELLASTEARDYSTRVELTKRLTECSLQSLVDMQLLLACCPESSSEESSHPTPLHPEDIPRLQRADGREHVERVSRQVSEWLTTLNNHLTDVRVVYQEMNLVREMAGHSAANIFAWRKRGPIEAAESFLATLKDSSGELISDLVNGDNYGILKPLSTLQSFLAGLVPFQSHSNSPVDYDTSSESEEDFYEDLDKLAKLLLLATQKLHNLWISPDATASTSGASQAARDREGPGIDERNQGSDVEDAAEDSDGVYDSDYQEDLLTTKSITGLEAAIRCIDLFKLRDLCENLMLRIAAEIYGGADADTVKTKVDALLLCQSSLATVIQCSHRLYIELLSLHRASAKLLSVMQGVFLELASKGFCRPDEVEFGEGKGGAQEFEDLEGTGLGEGQGMKDVSNEIETEDQLEDSHQAGKEEEKKTDEGDDDPIKEEEDGIEMSEDFEGQMQDADDTQEKEGDEDNDEDTETEDDLEKQMGDVDEFGEEQLDERMWGDDSDDEQDQKDGKDEEEQHGGEETGEEAQMVANVDVSEEGKGQRKDDKHGADDEENEDPDDKPKPEDDGSDVNEQVMEQDGDNSGDEVDDRQDPLTNQPNDVPDNLDLPDDLDLEDEADGDDGEDRNAEPNEEEDMDCDDEEESKTETQAEGSPNPELEAEEFDPDKNDEEAGPNNNDETNANENTGEHVIQDGAQSSAQDQAMNSEETAAAEEQQQNMDEDNSGKSANQRQVMDSQDGQMSVDSAPVSQANPSDKLPDQAQRRRDRSAHDRSQMEEEENPAKRRKMTDSAQKSEEQRARDDEMDEADLHRHVGDDEEHSVQDVAALDAANANESKQIAKKEKELTGEEADGVDESKLQPQHDDDDVEEKSDIPAQLKKESVEHGNKQKKSDGSVADNAEQASGSDAEQEKEEPESTRENKSFASASRLDEGDVIDMATMEKLRAELEHQLSTWSSPATTEELSPAAAAHLWHQYEVVSSRHAQTLCEQLRLVLEPTMAAKLKGDYRTGKRLNMRKVVAYVASQFRKDRIWLRRTKPSKRQYQLLLAVDDSASMTDCHAKQMTFEALAVVTSALRWLEAGQVGVCRFGETVDLLHPLQETFSEECGARLLQNLTFQQKETSFKQLLTFSTSLLTSARAQQGSTPTSVPGQLLIILSDGRGVFREGKEAVKRAVRTLIQHGIFAVFVVLDNVGNKDSVMDIKQLNFAQGSKPVVTGYMEDFPFPFYVVLRDINSLADVLGSAMRQWFEMLSVEHQ
ncbi:midasin-like [Sycon ciliatum]|uniref:midasin-like n=1 Tax=Sycon ciliatum TaxID=27933 RepID=UPI0031F6661A